MLFPQQSWQMTRFARFFWVLLDSFSYLKAGKIPAGLDVSVMASHFDGAGAGHVAWYQLHAELQVAATLAKSGHNRVKLRLPGHEILKSPWIMSFRISSWGNLLIQSKSIKEYWYILKIGSTFLTCNHWFLQSWTALTTPTSCKTKTGAVVCRMV